RVGLALTSGKQYVSALIGVMKAGLPVIPLNTQLTSPEMEAFLDQVRPQAVICDEAHSDLMGPAGVTKYVANFGSSGLTLRRWSQPGSASVPFNTTEDDEMLAIGTGGSTGVPKGAVMSRQAIWFWTACSASSQQIRVDDVELFSARFFHSTILTGLFTPLAAGATARIVDRFEPEVVERAVQNDSVTRIGGTPTVLMRIFELAQRSPQTWKNVRTVQFWSAKSPPGFVDALRDAFPNAQYMTGYGSTEFGPATRLYGRELLQGGGGVGRPIPTTSVVIVNPDNGQVTTDPKIVGEVAVKSPWQMSRYAGPTEDTRSAFLPTGEILSGDIGEFDAEGFLHLRGRRKEMILTGGENVFPSEVEDVLASHPAIREVAVYGIDDRVWGERVEAAVVTRQGVVVNLKEIRDFSRGRLAAYKLPRSLVQLEEMPLTPNWKIDKRQLATRSADNREIWASPNDGRDSTA
ncbi:MAG: class I adenylate-forming enzyme family protein, partial [Ilumatobacteraceae bacterium]